MHTLFSLSISTLLYALFSLSLERELAYIPYLLKGNSPIYPPGKGTTLFTLSLVSLEREFPPSQI
jgi:hypothetical protein